MSHLIPSDAAFHPPEPVRPGFVVPDAAPDGTEGGDLRDVVALLRRNALLIVLVALGTTAAAAAWAYTRPARYAATSVVRLADVRRALTGGIEEQAMERFTGSMTDPVLSQIEVLRSRSLLERAVDASGHRLRPVAFSSALLRDARTAPEVPADTLRLRFDESAYHVAGRAGTATAAYGAPVQLGGVSFTMDARPEAATAELVVVPRDVAVAELHASLSARQRERTDVVDVRFEHPDPVRAQQTLNGVVATFQAVNAERAQEQSRRRRVFIEEQLVAADSMLSSAQLQLSSFREQQSAFSTRERFSAQQQALMTLDIRREELAAERRVYAGLLARAGGSRPSDEVVRDLVANPAVATNPSVAALHGQLVRYQVARDSLLGGPNPRAASDPDVQRLEAVIGSTAARIVDAVRSHVATLEVRLAALDELRARNSAEMQAMPASEAQESRLAQQVVTVQAMADQLRKEYHTARMAEAVEAGQVEILDPAGEAARLPTRRGLLMVLGLVIGLALGGGVAGLREQLNTTFRRRDDVDRFLRIGTLAVVPRIDTATPDRVAGARGNGTRRAAAADVDASLVVARHTRSSGAEAYRSLRTNLIFSQAVRSMRGIAVTSAGPAEGKSTTAANLAAAFAQQGMRVLLVDCDLRRPRLHEFFHVPREPGFTQYLLGHGSLDELARPTAVPNLFVLPAGTLPPNPAELLGSTRAREVARMLADQFEVVIVDTPPVLLASDAAIVSSMVDGVVLVVRAGRTARVAAQQAARQIEAVGGRLLGVVLNDPDARVATYEESYGYGYGYDAYYGDAGDDALPARVPARTAGRDA